MRTLTPNALIGRAATSTSSTYILKVEWSTGTRYYSDTLLGTGSGLTALNADPRIKAWGSVSRAAQDTQAYGPGGVTDESVVLNDADKVLETSFKAIPMQRVPATLYLHFLGNLEADLTVIFGGTLTQEITWRRDEAVLRIQVNELGKYYDEYLGEIADKENWPYVHEEDENKYLPIVFGSPTRVPAVYVESDPMCILAMDLLAGALVFYVDDSSAFPQNTPIQVWVGHELVSGSFNGNTFTVTSRGDDLFVSAVTAPGTSAMNFYDDSIVMRNNQYTWCYINVTEPGGGPVNKMVTFCSSTDGHIGYYPQTQQWPGGGDWTMPALTPYTMTTLDKRHAAGEQVRLYRGANAEYVYIVNEQPSVRMTAVFGRGEIPQPILTDDTVIDTEVWIQINAYDYIVNTNDNRYVAQLGHNCTTISFPRDPKFIQPRLHSSRLFVDLEGCDENADGTGALIENPAYVVREILKRWLLIPAPEFDVPSFNDAYNKCRRYLMAFHINERIRGLEVATDLAFQARCMLVWEDGLARMEHLSNAIGVKDRDLDESSDYDPHGLAMQQTPVTEIVSEIKARWWFQQEERTVVVQDAAVEALYKRNVMEMDFWAYENPITVRTVATFWLGRWKYAYELLHLEVFLTAVELQRNDVVELVDAEFFDAGQQAWVLAVDHQPGQGEPPTFDTIGMDFRLPRFPGCENTCETDCEPDCQADCQVACQQDSESGCNACQAACQGLCQLTCVTARMVGCWIPDWMCDDIPPQDGTTTTSIGPTTSSTTSTTTSSTSTSTTTRPTSTTVVWWTTSTTTTTCTTAGPSTTRTTRTCTTTITTSSSTTTSTSTTTTTTTTTTETTTTTTTVESVCCDTGKWCHITFYGAEIHVPCFEKTELPECESGTCIETLIRTYPDCKDCCDANPDEDGGECSCRPTMPAGGGTAYLYKFTVEDPECDYATTTAP